MIFSLSSGRCSSLRWKKGKRKIDWRKAKRFKEEVKSKRQPHGWPWWWRWSKSKTQLEPNVSMDDQRKCNRACMRALSGCTCECCEAPRNRWCAVCACHPRRHWCSRSTCIIYFLLQVSVLQVVRVIQLFSRSHVWHVFSLNSHGILDLEYLHLKVLRLVK